MIARKNKGFTLIELLVVIGIIALLAAIMMPSLRAARESARGAACVSNEKNIGMALAVYAQDGRGYLPASYSYLSGNDAGGGCYHWTAMLNPQDYDGNVHDGASMPKHAPEYICPSHVPAGFAPTNFTSTRIPTPAPCQVAQNNAIDDEQAPRMSYVANEVLMGSAAHDANNTGNLCYVSVDEVDHVNQTILLAEYTNYPSALSAGSAGGSMVLNSHSPANTLCIGASSTTNAFDGEKYVAGSDVHKLKIADAQAAIQQAITDTTGSSTPGLVHVTYLNLAAHNGYSNYTFADGHAAKYSLGEVLDPGDWLWGNKVYSCMDKPLVKD